MVEGNTGVVKGGGEGRERKIGNTAELPSERLSHSSGLHDPPGNPKPGCDWAAEHGRCPQGWCAAQWGGGDSKDITAAWFVGEGKGVRTSLGSFPQPALAEGSRGAFANSPLHLSGGRKAWKGEGGAIKRKCPFEFGFSLFKDLKCLSPVPPTGAFWYPLLEGEDCTFKPLV